MSSGDVNVATFGSDVTDFDSTITCSPNVHQGTKQRKKILLRPLQRTFLNLVLAHKHRPISDLPLLQFIHFLLDTINIHRERLENRLDPVECSEL